MPVDQPAPGFGVAQTDRLPQAGRARLPELVRTVGAKKLAIDDPAVLRFVAVAEAFSRLLEKRAPRSKRKFIELSLKAVLALHPAWNCPTSIRNLNITPEESRSCESTVRHTGRFCTASRVPWEPTSCISRSSTQSEGESRSPPSFPTIFRASIATSPGAFVPCANTRKRCHRAWSGSGSSTSRVTGEDMQQVRSTPCTASFRMPSPAPTVSPAAWRPPAPGP